MPLLYQSPRFLDHRTGQHPESPVRLEHITERLEESGLPQQCTRPEWQPAEHKLLAAVHGGRYLAELEEFAKRGGGRLDPDTVVSPDSWDVAQLAAGAVCDAVRRVTAGEDNAALCLVRPPGHHALPTHAMGFCLLANISIAARYAIDHCSVNRALIVDWDVHHGNGTQDIFYEDGQVGFISLHRWPFYPGTGADDETGTGAGLGATLNLPTAYGTPRKEILSRFETELTDFADRMKPELVLISAGFDAHRLDPVGSLGLESEDFAELTRMVQRVADQHAHGRIVSVLEGGYHPPALAESVELHLRELMTHV